jgi:glycosyltransferase involved in cell wall biosynthesis
VDSDFWHPYDRAAARQTLGLPEHELIVLAGGFALGRDARKGGKFLPEVLAAAQRRLPGRALRLVVVGAHTLDPAQFAPLPLTSAGHLADDARLRLYYAAADAFVLPSLEDNLPNMVLEAAACGVPTAAFSAGGVADLIDPGQTGVLAPPADPQALGERLAWMACDAQRLAQLGQAARRRAQSLFAPAVIAARHAALYAHALDLSARSQ